MLAIIVLFLNIIFFQLTHGYQELSINNLEQIERLNLNTVVGPESLAFDHFGHGPYTGVSGGRILKWQGIGNGWADFAINYEHRSPECDGSSAISLESSCGRPLGLQFHTSSGTLYIADAFFGLLSVGPNGGAAILLAATAEGGPFKFTNGVDVDQNSGAVYFTDSSTKYRRADYLLAVLLNDSTGRLMKYEPSTHTVTVLKHDIPFPNGVALSDDNSFLLFAETGNCRIIKYWIHSGETQVFAELPGYPDNIKRTTSGDFWVAINRQKIDLNTVANYKESNNINHNLLGSVPEVMQTVALKFSREGKVLKALQGGMETSVSEVLELNGTIWVGSVDVPYVGVYKLQACS